MADKDLKLRHPIVLIHGLGAQRQMGLIHYFHDLPRRLEEAGNKVFLPNLSLWNTLETRSQQLKEQIEAAFPEGEKLNLVGHSMGGVDARYLVSALGFAPRVASLTTIGSPNRGTPLADMTVGLLSDDMFHAAERVINRFNWSNEGFRQLGTRSFAEELEGRLGDAPGVSYFSATSVIREPIMRTALPIFWLTERVLRRYEGENDGFVSEHSARWGEHLGTWVGDHYGQIGQVLGRTRGLDYVNLFETVVGRLRDEGF